MIEIVRTLTRRKPRRVPVVEEGKAKNDKEAKRESHAQFQGRTFGCKSEMSSSDAKSFVRPQLNHKPAVLMQ